MFNCRMAGAALALGAALLTTSGCRQRTFGEQAETNSLTTAQQKQLACVDSLMSSLGIHGAEETDPTEITTILHDDMMLDDLQPVRTLLGAALSHPVSMEEMISKIRLGIVEKHPAIGEFVCAAQQQNLIPRPDAEDRKTIQRTLQHTFILDRLTKEMFDHPEFMTQIRTHLFKKRQSLGIRNDFIGSTIDIVEATGQLFEPAKAKTMDWVLSEYERIRSEGRIPENEVQTRRNGLILNIVEAVLTDRKTGFQKNATAGVALAINPPQIVRVSDENRYIEYGLSQTWASLYETWNFSFITGNMENLNLLYPKLLIPQVLCAAPEKYLFNRALSLWVTINFDLFAKIKGIKRKMPHSDQLAALWGDINLRYAKAYVTEKNHFDLRGISDLVRAPLQGWAKDHMNKRIGENN